MKSEDWFAIGLTPKARLSFARILELAFDHGTLRELASKHGTKPKGFRIERATAAQLADAIATDFVDKKALREEVALALAQEGSSPVRSKAESQASADPKLRLELQRLELEAAKLREKSAKAEQSALRASTSRDDALAQRAEAERRALELELRCTELEEAIERLEHRLLEESEGAGCADESSETGARVRFLEAEVAARDERDEKQRIRIAELTSQVRALESENAELLDFLPRGERERRKQKLRSYTADRRSTVLVPSFDDEFFRNVEEFDATSKRKIYAAVAKLILHGPEYPGLQTKALKGMDGLSSIRAADDLRVYLRREGESVRIEACGNREQQEAFLKKRRG